MPTTGFHRRDIETMPRPELEALQLERLRTTVRRLRTTAPAMADRLRDIDDPASLADITKFPFLRKSDLRDNYPFGLFAVPRHEVARVHVSSGTTGKPTVVGYTAEDLSVWADCVARCLRGAGVEPGHLLHNAYGYGLFTGGLGLHAGAEAAGIGVIPMSGGNTERQLMLLDDFAPEAICCTPSYALTLAELLGERGPATSLQVGILGAEPWSLRTREAIEAGLGIIAVNIYGLSEVIGPGIACETADRDGLVLMEDHFLPEIVDPETGEQLARRRRRRARPDEPHQAGVPRAAVLDRRPVFVVPRTSSLRSYPCPDVVRGRPRRRHARHQGGQRVPEPGRARPARGRRREPALPTRRQPGRNARHAPHPRRTSRAGAGTR